MATAASPKNLTGVAKSVTYDGALVSSVTENGVTAGFTLDSAGRVEEMTLHGATHSFVYEDAGDGVGERYKTKTITDGDGSTLLGDEYTYDAAGRLEMIESLGGRTRTFTRFPDGSVKTMAIGGTEMTEIERDTKGRLISSRANQVRIAYGGYDDKTGSPQSESMTVLNGAAALAVTKIYDDHGRLMESTTPAGTWRFTYDGWGNLISKRDPDGVEVSWTRSPSGYLLGADFFDGSSVSYSYDSKRRVDSIDTANGSIGYGYDGDNLTKSVAYPDGTTQAIGERNGFFEASTVSYGGDHPDLRLRCARPRHIDQLPKRRHLDLRLRRSGEEALR